MTISESQKIILYTTLFSSIINILLNFIMIKKYGIEGAVYATVLTQILSLSLLNIAFEKTRVLFFIQTKSLLLMGIWSKK
jgi:O-antigen/teichoic acid export membrane protein